MTLQRTVPPMLADAQDGGRGDMPKAPYVPAELLQPPEESPLVIGEEELGPRMSAPLTL